MTDDEQALVVQMKRLFKKRVMHMTFARFIECFEIAKKELYEEKSLGSPELSFGDGLPKGPITKQTPTTDRK